MIERVREYKIISKIGEGGMGVVYKAFDENLDRVVALKAIHTTLTMDENIIMRFKNEAKVQASLMHPNIVFLHHFFRENNAYFIVMEYVDGITLKDLIKKQKQLNEQQATSILLQLLEGLSYAHSMGVVHRDLKPSNVLITPDNRVKILDFGVAKVLGNRGLTSTGVKLGTLYYMSPEQIKGAKDIDQRTDIYSLGIILYEMLTGKVPFNTETESDFEIMQEIVFKSIENPKKINPHISDRIVEIFSKMTQKDYEQRYKTCYQCIEDINREQSKDNIKIIETPIPKVTNSSVSNIVKPVKSKIKNVRLLTQINTIKGLSKLINLKSRIISIAFHPNNKMVVSGDTLDKVKIWDVNDGQMINCLEGHKDYVNSVAFSQDGRFIISGSGDSNINLWRVSSGELIKTLEGHTASVISISLSPDGAFIVSGGADRTVRLWDVQKKNIIRTFRGHKDFVLTVAFNPDGKRIVSGGKDNFIKFWDVITGDLIRTFEGHTEAVTSVVFSHESETIISGSNDRTIRVWDVNTGEVIKKIKAHKDFINSISLSPDGRYIFSGSDDYTAKLWDIDSGKVIKIITEHSDSVNCVAFSRDGNYLASGGFDGVINIYKIEYE